MPGPFSEQIKKLVDRVEGAVAGVLMGFNGISVEMYATPGAAAVIPDLQTTAIEFSHLISQTRRMLQSLDAGALEEFTLRTHTMTLAVRVLTAEYFLACAMSPAGSVGKARYLMRQAAPVLRAEL